MERKSLVYLSLILILGAILRLSFLTFNPPSLNWDEVSHGYNAYSILKTGMDEWGQKFPIFNFRAYGDYPTTLNLYLTVPFVAFLGLNEFSIRLPHAILGVLTIIASYFLALGLTKRKDVSLLVAFLVAVGPWYLFTSRFVLQSNVSVFLLISSMAFFFNREKNKYFLGVSYLFIFLTLFSYHTTRIFSPLLLAGLILIYRGELFNSRLLKLFVAVFFVSTFVIFQNPESRARGSTLFLLDQAVVNRIEEARNASKLPQSLKVLLYNRPAYFIKEFSRNYISYFSPKFLFFEGGTQYQFSLPKHGLLYLINLPFFYLGILLLVKKARKEVDYRMVLLWLLISPIPASLTNEKFAVLRATPMLPLPEILTAIGLYFVIEKYLKKRNALTTMLYSIVILFSLESYLFIYFTKYRRDFSWAWQYGYKEVVSFAKENYDRYDKIIVTKKYGEPHEFFLFFWPWDPKKYLTDPNLNRFYQSNWWWVDGFDKFVFINDWQVKDKESERAFITESKKIIDCVSAKCLLVTSPGNVADGWKKLKTVNFLDDRPAFEIYDNK